MSTGAWSRARSNEGPICMSSTGADGWTLLVFDIMRGRVAKSRAFRRTSQDASLEVCRRVQRWSNQICCPAVPIAGLAADRLRSSQRSNANRFLNAATSHQTDTGDGLCPRPRVEPPTPKLNSSIRRRPHPCSTSGGAPVTLTRWETIMEICSALANCRCQNFDDPEVDRNGRNLVEHLRVTAGSSGGNFKP